VSRLQDYLRLLAELQADALEQLSPDEYRDFVDRMADEWGREYARLFATGEIPRLRLADRGGL
jgi:hypothetical protein